MGSREAGALAVFIVDPLSVTYKCPIRAIGEAPPSTTTSSDARSGTESTNRSSPNDDT
jgi:hypothetical protein